MNKSIFNTSKVLLLVLVLVLSSCKDGNEKAKKSNTPVGLITAHKWEMVKAKDNKGNESDPQGDNTVFEFLKDGTIKAFSKLDGKEFDMGDPQKWVIKDSIFTFGRTGDAKILKLDSDSLIIEGKMPTGDKIIAYFAEFDMSKIKKADEPKESKTSEKDEKGK